MTRKFRISYKITYLDEMEIQTVSIIRTVRTPQQEAAAYIEPPHLILTPVVMTDEEVITTAVFWMIGKRPTAIHTRVIPLTQPTKEMHDNALASPYSDQLIVFLGMAGAMVLGKEIKLTGTAANYEYLLKKMGGSLCYRRA